MILELIKEYDEKGDISYHIQLEGKYVAKTLCFDLEVAMEHYNKVREGMTRARKTTLLREEL